MFRLSCDDVYIYNWFSFCMAHHMIMHVHMWLIDGHLQNSYIMTLLLHAYTNVMSIIYRSRSYIFALFYLFFRFINMTKFK